MVDAARLREIDALVRRRRSSWHPVLLTMAGGLVVAGLLALLAWRRGPGAAQALWLTASALVPAWVAMAGPWRLLWRDDARIVSRLPIGGKALFDRGAAECFEHAGLVALFLGVAALTAFLPGDPLVLGRALVAVALPLVVAALLSPAVALAGGVLATSKDAQRTIGEVTGAGAGPQMVWVSLLPGLAGGAVILVGIRPSWLVYGAAVAGALVLYGAARAAAPRLLPAAMRDMAAADRVRLAHVDLDGARGLEKAWGGVAGRLIYEKDVALARRRYPAYFLLGGLVTIIAWGVAAFTKSEATRWNWTLGAGAALSVYTVILAGRLVRSPVEEDHLVTTLPWSRGRLVRAKLGYVAWRAVVPLAVATVPGVARAGADRWLLAGWLAAMAAGAIAAGAVRITRTRSRT